MARPRPRIGSELFLVVLILGCLAGSWCLVVSIHKRAALAQRVKTRRAPAPAPVPAPVVAVAPLPPRPKAKPRPAAEEDPTRRIVANIGTEEAQQILAAQAADRRAEALERAARAALAENERWRKREQMVKLQVSQLAERARNLEHEADALAMDRDMLERERDALKAAVAKARNRSSFAVLPSRSANGTWRRPIVIECSNGTATLQPNGPAFSLLDLSGLLIGRSSPIVVAVVRELMRVQGMTAADGSPTVPYIFFVVRPDGIRPYYDARARLEPLGIAFGYELVDKEMEIDYPDLDHPEEWDGEAPLRPFPLTMGNEGTGPHGGGNGPGQGGGDDIVVWPAPPPGSGSGEGDGLGAGRVPGRFGGTGMGSGTGRGINGGSFAQGGGSEIAGGRGGGSFAQGGGSGIAGGRGGGSFAQGGGSGIAGGRGGQGSGYPPVGSSGGNPFGQRDLIPPGTSDGAGGFAASGPDRSAGGLGSPGMMPPSQASMATPGMLPVTGGFVGSMNSGSFAQRGASGTGMSGSSAGTGGPGTFTQTGSGGALGGSQPPGGSTASGDAVMPAQSLGSAGGLSQATGRSSGSPGARTQTRPARSAGGTPASSNPGQLGYASSTPGGSGNGMPSMSNSTPVPIPNVTLNGIQDGPAGGDGAQGGSASATDPSAGSQPAGGGNASQAGRQLLASGASGKPTVSFPIGGMPQSASGGSSDGGSGDPGGSIGSLGAPSSPLNKPSRIEVPMEIVVACGPAGVVIHPGGYRLSAKTLKGKDEVLAKSLKSIVRNRQLVDPLIKPIPQILFLIEPGGDQSYRDARRQTVFSGIDWPVSLQVSDTRLMDLMPKERF